MLVFQMRELVPLIIACIVTNLAARVLLCILFALVLACIIKLNSIWSHSSSPVTVLCQIGSFFWLLYLRDKQSTIPSLPSSVSLAPPLPFSKQALSSRLYL